MTYVFAPNHVDTTSSHYKSVLAEMRTRGAPVIRVAKCDCGYSAVEGSHRLTAAAELGLMPVFELVGEDEEVDHDFDDVASRRVGDLIAYLHAGSPHDGSPVFEVLDEDGAAADIADDYACQIKAA
jgi:hypothetical protein